MDEDIRFISGGSEYFDVRDNNDEWIRIKCLPGDLIILTVGVYHRFILDEKNYITIKSFFIREDVWSPHNRPADDFADRKEYVKWMEKGF